MRAKIGIGRRLALALLVAVSVSSAQSKPGGAKGGVKAAEVDLDADEGDADAEPSEDEGATPKGSGDPELDAPPPKSTSDNDGKKLSPLNPEPDEFPSKATSPAPKELATLLSDIAALRARVAALTTSLFRSKLRVYVRTEGDDSAVKSFAITVDDGVVFRAPSQFSSGGERPLYEHAIAPGNHVIGVEIERYDVRGQTFKTWQVSKFAVVIPENELLEADILLEDDSDMADDFPDDQDGEYELDVKLRARVADR